MKELIGKTVVELFVVEDNEIIFKTTEGRLLSYCVEGDCCSHSYYYEVNGIHNLLNSEIVEIEQKDLGGAIPKPGEDCVEAYGITILTRKGHCDIEFRNDSNGYYGGYLCDATDITEKGLQENSRAIITDGELNFPLQPDQVEKIKEIKQSTPTMALVSLINSLRDRALQKMGEAPRLAINEHHWQYLIRKPLNRYYSGEANDIMAMIREEHT